MLQERFKMDIIKSNMPYTFNNFISQLWKLCAQLNSFCRLIYLIWVIQCITSQPVIWSQTVKQIVVLWRLFLLKVTSRFSWARWPLVTLQLPMLSWHAFSLSRMPRTSIIYVYLSIGGSMVLTIHSSKLKNQIPKYCCLLNTSGSYFLG